MGASSTRVTGVGGKVTIPDAAGGTTGFITSWRADITREVIDATTFDDLTNARTKLGGMYDLKGSCEAWFAKDDVPDIADFLIEDAEPTAVATFELIGVRDDAVSANNKGYNFGGIISSLSINVEKVGQARVTISFESSGDISATFA